MNTRRLLYKYNKISINHINQFWGIPENPSFPIIEQPKLLLRIMYKDIEFTII